MINIEIQIIEEKITPCAELNKKPKSWGNKSFRKLNKIGYYRLMQKKRRKNSKNRKIQS
jgi:hypothetical protein